MNWLSIPNEERLRLWKSMRDNIKDKSLDDQLYEIASFCSKIPFETRTIDYYTPESWPSPWDILYYGSFCTSSISLLMCYTLMLVNPECEVELHLVEDNFGIYLILVVNNQYVLNYELGQISNYSQIKHLFRLHKVIGKENIKAIR